MTFIVYSNATEIIVTTESEEKSCIRDYFEDSPDHDCVGTGWRDLKDFTRKVSVSSGPGISITAASLQFSRNSNKYSPY